jgi:hypothetical protein
MARPTSYLPKYASQAYKLCLLGATDKDLADFFEVAESTINNWKLEHPRFLESLKRGKDTADATVAESLFKRANGYKHKAVKIFCTKDGNIVEAPYVEHYAPDTTACIFWLKNRKSQAWRDRQEASPEDAADVARAVRDAIRAMDDADGTSAAA